MGKIKEMLLNEIDGDYQDDYDFEYQQWLASDEFVEYVNGELEKSKPRYSESDVMGAIRYASKSITIDPSEVGKEVYDMLFSEKIEEYLSLHTNDGF